MLIDLFFLPVHVPVGAPDVAQQILAVCRVVVLSLCSQRTTLASWPPHPDSEASQNLRC